MSCISLHSLLARPLAVLLLLALVVLPPLALAMPAATVPAPVPAALALPGPAAQAAADCAGHHPQAGDRQAADQRTAPADLPCKAGCAACIGCIVAQAALLPAMAATVMPVASAPQSAAPPALRLTRRSHPPLRPPSL